MPVLSESGLKEKLRSTPTGAYLIYGDEDYLKKVYVDRIIDKTVDKSFEDFNLHVFDGNEAVLGDVYDSAQAFPVMSETNCIVVKDMPLDTLDTGNVALLNELLSELPESCALVFCMISRSVSGEKWKKIINLFDTFGSVVKLDKKEKNDLVRTIEKGAENRGAPFAAGVASYLISCVGSDLNTVINETDKLCSYAKGRTVTKDDVDAVCPKTLEAKVFDITKALHSGRFSIAQQKLSNVIAQKEDPLMILGAFIMSYTDMYRVRAAVTAGKRAEDVAKLYNYSGKVFRLTNAQRESHGLSLSSIYSCIELLAEADRMMKSSSVSKTLILEQTLARLAIYEGNDR